MSKKTIIIFIFSSIILFGTTSATNAELYMSISGKVMDKNTNQGIPEIILLIKNRTSEKMYQTKTDINGFYSFKSLQEGTYNFVNFNWTIRSLPPQYIVDDSLIQRRELKLENGKNIKNFHIYVIPGASITGKIFAEDGITPLSGVYVKYETHHLAQMIGISNKVKTGEDGSYMIQGLSCMLPYILLDFRCWGMPDKIIKVENLAPGATIENIDFICKPKTKISIEGRVLDKETNEPIEGAFLSLYLTKGQLLDPTLCPHDNVSGGYAQTDSNGHFIFRGFAKCKYNLLIETDTEEIFYTNIMINKDVTNLGILYLNHSKKKMSYDFSNGGYDKNKPTNTSNTKGDYECDKILDCTCEYNSYWKDKTDEIVSNMGAACQRFNQTYENQGLNHFNKHMLECIDKKCDSIDNCYISKIHVVCCSLTSADYACNRCKEEQKYCAFGTLETGNTIFLCPRDRCLCYQASVLLHELTHTCDGIKECDKDPSDPYVEPHTYEECVEHRATMMTCIALFGVQSCFDDCNFADNLFRECIKLLNEDESCKKLPL